ncbi:MAG: N-acetylmuramoyl-L-alanine amidase [Verrucomicrobia bacterium]|nr:N-acetylmuramoyl-L-alanine amidase [Verrucomicrobiota bacterium]
MAVKRFPLLLYFGCVYLLVSVPLQAYHLGMLGEAPDWSELDEYQKSMSRSEFEEALNTVYLPYGFDDNWITIYPGYALIRTDGHDPAANYKLHFAPRVQFEEKSDESVSESNAEDGPALKGLVIAIDPGHIGGAFSEMERRHFQIGEDPPVKEGDLTLQVSRKLVRKLEDLGARVRLVRSDLQPVTQKQPEDFFDEAEAIEQRIWLESQSIFLNNTPWVTQWFQNRIKERAEMLFYRVSEIQTRAKIINEQIKPDLSLSIHFNVSPWPDITEQVLPAENHMHVLVNGTYTPDELALDDVRLHLLKKLLSRNHEVEIPLSESVANALAGITGLPPFTYGGSNASNQGNSKFLWARNLLANRLYEGPVVFLEIYCTNSKEAYQRIQMGDYEGLKEVNGSMRPSLFAEYADGIVQGLVDYYSRGQ